MGMHDISNHLETGAICGGELYHRIQQLIMDWMGLDAGDRTALVGQLVRDIVRLTEQREGISRLAAHDMADQL